MNDERIPWQADDLESGAVQVSGRPIHASWSILREHFRRVFLEPHRPAGSDVVGWRWLGASVPRAPEAADLADLRLLLQHALLDITADLERREEDPANTSPKEILAAIQTIVHELSESTDIDLGTYAVETNTGWFIRSWGFSHPAPAKLADPSTEAEETAQETPVDQAVPEVKPPVTKRTKLIRWAAGVLVVIGAATAFFWVKGGARTSHREVKPNQPELATGRTPSAPAAEATHQDPHLAVHSAAAETPTQGTTVAPAAPSLAPAPSAHSNGLATGAAHEGHAQGLAFPPVPSAQIGGMPVLAGPTGNQDGAHAITSSNDEALLKPTNLGGPGASDTSTTRTAESADNSGANTAKAPGTDTATPLDGHDGGKEGAEPPLGSRTVAILPEAPPAASKETAASIDAVALHEIPSQPTPESALPTTPSPTDSAPAQPQDAAPEVTASTAVAPKSGEHPAVEDIAPVNKTANAPATESPPTIKFDLTPDALAEVHITGKNNSKARKPVGVETSETPSLEGAANAESGKPAAAASEPVDASAPKQVEAHAEAKKPVEETTITYQIGECQVRSLHDPVLATVPAERPSNPMLAEARAHAWAGTQSSKPESFRKPVVNGGWNFRPAKGATWTKHPIWLDITTGKPVEGLRISPNGMHLNWTGLMPKEGFTAHIVDEEGIEQARMTVSPAERRIEVTTIAVFSESSPAFTVELTAREAVAGTLVWRSRTPTWSDRRWETQLTGRQINVNCLPTPATTKEPTYGVVALSHPSSGWALTWEVSTRPGTKSLAAQ